MRCEVDKLDGHPWPIGTRFDDLASHRARSLWQVQRKLNLSVGGMGERLRQEDSGGGKIFRRLKIQRIRRALFDGDRNAFPWCAAPVQQFAPHGHDMPPSSALGQVCGPTRGKCEPLLSE